MRRPPRCAPNQGLPRAVQTLRCMPARRSSLKPPKTTEAHANLATLGFRVADSGPHTSKIPMLLELETLLAACPVDAPAKAYRVSIVEENVLSKRTLSTRKETALRLSALHGLVLTKPLFRVLRRLWGVAPTTFTQLVSITHQSCACNCVWHMPLARALTPTSEEEG
jgi:hypothetical protein